MATAIAIWGAMFAAASVPPAIAWWAWVRVRAWPRRGRARHIEGFWVGLIGGAIASIVSVAGLLWFEVGEGEAIEQIGQMFTGVEGAPWWVLGPSLASMVAVYAVTEEITYRGLLLPALWRLFGRGEWAFWIATALVSLAWALMHVPNTDRPDLKILQIFVLGLGLGWLTRRYGLQSAIAAHVGLNVAAVVLEFGVMR
ncbi:MAG: type II CAAX endopeptidase family protein [Planctomycetota bacterium]